jgi:hypothetical protein
LIVCPTIDNIVPFGIIVPSEKVKSLIASLVDVAEGQLTHQYRLVSKERAIDLLQYHTTAVIL